MRRIVSSFMLAAIAACGSPPAPSTPATGSIAHGEDMLDAFARRIDPGPQAPLWPQMPTDVRGKVELDAPRDASREARLKAGIERLEGWTLQVSTTDFGALAPKVARALEGIYLVEPIALAEETDDTTTEARAALWRFYDAFATTIPLLESFEASFGKNAGGALAMPLAVAKLLASAGPPMSDHLAARILLAKRPPRTFQDVVWQKASSTAAKGDTTTARALYAEYIRLARGSLSADDWLRVAFAHVRLENPSAAADAIARAKAAAPPGDRAIAARVRDAETSRDRLTRLLALPSDQSAATLLARFDALMDLGRTPEAAVVLDAAKAGYAKDGRVRARDVRLRVARGEISASLGDRLRDETLTDKNGEYWSIRAGAAGMALAKAAPTPAALDEVALCARELARFEPGRAAALSFLVERVTRMLQKPLDSKAVVEAVQSSFSDAVALREKTPETADADRIVIALALFLADPSKGLQAALVRPKTRSEDDPSLYLARARTVVTLAAYADKAADLGAVRRAVDEISAATDAAGEATREALLGDVELLAALQGDRDGWARAAKRYEAARKGATNDRARLDNNLAFIAESAGDAEAARKRFESAANAQSGRRWVPLLNLATSPKASKDDQLAAVRAIAGPEDASPPPLVNAWRAVLAADGDEAKKSATRALVDFDDALALHKVDLARRGLETEGSLALSLGLVSGKLSHVLEVSAYASLWLVRPMPIGRAELEAKAKAKDKEKPKPAKR